MSRKKVQHVGKILFSILSVLLGFLGILLFTSSRWMLATWAHLDMEELVYHLKAPLEVPARMCSGVTSGPAA